MKIKQQQLYFTLIIFLLFFGTISKFTTYVAIIFSSFIAIIIANNDKEISSTTCIGIIFLLCFQNFAIGLGAHCTGKLFPEIKLLTQIPFLTILIIWITIVLRNNSRNEKISKPGKIFLIYLLNLFVVALISIGTIESVLINIRNMTVFYMAFSIGKYSIKDKDELDNFYDKFEKLSIFMVIIGILLLIGGYQLYHKIGIDEVYFAKGEPITNQFSPRFFTTIFHIPVVRMGSLYYEPVNLGYFFAASFLLSLFYKKNNKKNKIYIIFSLLGLILSFGKGALLLVGISLIIIVGINILKPILIRSSEKSTRKLIVFLGIVFFVMFSLYYYRKIGGTVNNHFWGLIQTWESVKTQPFGHGLGTGGNMATLFNNNSNMWLSSGGESGAMSFMYQYGISGFIIFFLCLINLMPKEQKEQNDNFFRICRILPIILIAVFFLQENTFTPQCIVPFMIFIGASNNIIKECNNG